jgi:hypothetical protein
MHALITRERVEISKSSNVFGFSRPKAIFLSKKIDLQHDALLKIAKNNKEYDIVTILFDIVTFQYDMVTFQV